MRVCVITLAFDAFKGGNHLPLFAALKDVEFTILTNTAKPKNPALPPNIKIETLNARIGPYYYGIADALFARAILRRYPPAHPFWTQFDVIHLNQVMGKQFLRLRGTGRPLLSFIHHPVSADRAIAVEETGGLATLRWTLKYALLCRWQRLLARGMPHVATVSHAAARRISGDYGRAEAEIAIIPNGVDGSVFTPGDLAHADFDVIALGALIHPRKGFRYLLEAYRALGARGYRIADVGRRSQDQRQALATIPGVRVFGTVPQEQLLTLLQRSAVLISTSLYEGFGLSLIEALACGRPAFAFDAGAVNEVLSPVDPNLLVPVRDVGELARRVDAFLQLPAEERMQKGTQYRSNVLQLYPLDHSAQTLHQLYESLT